MITSDVPAGPDIAPVEPDAADVEQRVEALIAAWQRAPDAAARLDVVRQWEALRRRVRTWLSVARLRFMQDTADAQAKAAQERADTLEPRIAETETAMKLAFLDETHRAELEAAFGSQPMALWAADVETVDPRLRERRVEEQKLTVRYLALLASARVVFDGEELTLSAVRAPAMSNDRDTRFRAASAQWGWYGSNVAELDELFDRLVALRTDMARTLGHKTFVPVGYRRMRRVDYGRADVERFRAEVHQHVVPLVQRLMDRRASQHGLDAVCAWDEKIPGPRGEPRPVVHGEALLDAVRDGLAELSTPLGQFVSMAIDRKLLDTEDRPGKGFGGFCTTLFDAGVPFVFANFNDTADDVRVLVHELGHAYQSWRSRSHPLIEGWRCTSETAEIHSMGLEFLAWPLGERLFGDAAEQWRLTHLGNQLAFLPYGVAVDEFQHQVYEHAGEGASARHGRWQALERRWVPWRRWEDETLGHPRLAHPGMGGAWQSQRHIYAYPFYYIDYTLAASVALQLWARSRSDHAGAMNAWQGLCERGGTLGFRGSVERAGLVTPFEEGCLARVVDEAAAALDL